MIKWIALAVFGLFFFIDILLILGSAELERRRDSDIEEVRREAYDSGFYDGYVRGKGADDE